MKLQKHIIIARSPIEGQLHIEQLVDKVRIFHPDSRVEYQNGKTRVLGRRIAVQWRIVDWM